jgi:hypothetical protein
MISRRGAAVAAIVLVLGSASALAQTRTIQFVEYSAKFMCGVVDAQAPGAAPVRPGTYETSINIHNPQLPLQPLPKVTFLKKAVLAPREGEEPVAPSRFRVDVLVADFAEHVDCKVIRDILGPAGTAAFIEGYVVLIVIPSPLTVPHELDVTGVYTVTDQRQGIALEMLTIPARIVPFPLAAGTKLRDKMMEDAKKKE